MAKLIYVESSPRKERSHSIKIARTFLDEYSKVNPTDSIETIDLWDKHLPDFNEDRLNAKYSLMHGQNPTDSEQEAWKEIESLFEEFNDADKYVFSVPMWNFGFPYTLKHYIDVITQPGLAWSHSPDEGFKGLVRGKALAIYATGGSYAPGSETEAFDLQKPSFEGWLGFIGLTDISRLIMAPTLASPEDLITLENALSEEVKKLASVF
ncbi:MAG: NAD(P)H-dependent oxidoreductase [Pseudomonadota bacterium]|nr:NAD(P)H-dependent oxidoreductase [Pseudomonadota bacterium]